MAIVAKERGGHYVQFYDDTAYLAGRVAGFLQQSLVRGGAAICVARAHNLVSIEQELRAKGLQTEAMRSRGQLVLLPAEELLATFMAGALPDPTKFREHVGGLIQRTRAAFPHDELHIYGEMVDVLWAREQPEAVLALEALWSELAGVSPFSLLCGYRLGGFAEERHVRHFEALCSGHDHVSPSEQFATLGVDPKSARVIAQLEQRSLALESEVARRKSAEERMQELFAIATELASASDRDTIARIAVDKAMLAVGASSGALWIVDGNQLRLIGIGSRHEQERERFAQLPLSADIPLAHCVRTGEALFLTREDYRARFPASAARVADTLASDRIGIALLPLASGGKPFGGMCFSFDNGSEFSDSERLFLTILTRQCALAIDRALLIENERTARREAELLYELTVEVNRTDEIDKVYELALDTVERGTHADRSAIVLFEQDGVMRFKSSHGLSETYRKAVEGHSPWKPDDTNPMPISIADVETDPAWASYIPVFRAEGIRSIAFVPVVHRRKLLGKFMLYRNEPLPFLPREIQLTSTVAVHVAQAIERKRGEKELARAYREEKQAHAEAEEATRAREEILSVVSHDLRNPLGTIMMGAGTLLNVDAGDKTAKIRTVAERIHRQAERMARLIEDLVDFAGIQAGRLALERGTHSPRDILSAASDIFAPVAQERGVKFEANTRSDLPTVRCDPERAVQVLSNLLANAIKVTPKGGAISIGAEGTGDGVVFYVRDSGPGIDADELPLLFERYWRSKKQSYKGAGLGLSIARGIVDAHGGRIWAESQSGAGATFYFQLPSGSHHGN